MYCEKNMKTRQCFFVERLKRTVFVNTIILLFVKVFPSHAWQHATACVHATDPLGGRIQWAARVITRNELMNKKRVIYIALSVAVNCMTQTSTGFKITLKVFHMYCKTYHKNSSYRNMVHANIRSCIHYRISPSCLNNKLDIVFKCCLFICNWSKV